MQLITDAPTTFSNGEGEIRSAAPKTASTPARSFAKPNELGVLSVLRPLNNAENLRFEPNVNGEGEIRTPEWGYPHCWFSKPVRSTALAPLQVPDRSPPGGNIQICGDGFSGKGCEFRQNARAMKEFLYNENRHKQPMTTISSKDRASCHSRLRAIAWVAGIVTLAVVALGARFGQPEQKTLADVRFPADGTVDFARDVKPIFAAACVECHGAAKRKGGLRLDIKAAAMEGGKSGDLFVAGDSAHSMLIDRVTGRDQDQQMPLDKDPLPEECIRILTAWVDQGAVWPDDGISKDEHVEETHWAFVKPVRVEPPAVKDSDWARNPIDQFVLAKLDEQNLKPSAPAAKSDLLRRVTLDLTGLPPTLEELDSFLADDKPDAYERVVDRLLASPQYGVNLARGWLDLARYADSTGYEKDRSRSIWPFRDWVIDALNADMPFDQFTIEQLAGDLLPVPTQSQLIATGFHRNTMMNEEDGVDAEEYRVNAVIDRANTTASVWLGQTLGCAQCHDHKYDPFSQKEYYSFFAFFNDQAEESRLVGASSVFHDISPKISILDKFEPNRKQIQVMEEEFKALAAESPEAAAKKAEIDALKQNTPAVVTTLVMKELPTPRDTKVLERGSFLSPGESVEPGVPAVLGKIESPGRPNREALAKWIVSPENPVTARVAMNRIWTHHFGRGIVETSENFGTRGTPPSHPELLDWLATEFVKQRWSLKAMHRLVVTSATYRQSASASDRLRELDPDNVLLARGPRVRLEAEVVRDQALAIGGLLSKKMGGPPVFPVQPEGFLQTPYSDNRWKTSEGEDLHRRSIYTFWRRTSPYPSFTTFDAPSRQVSCTRRPRTNTPLQALTTLNDPVYMEAAKGLAVRVIASDQHDVAGRITLAMKLCLARGPDAEELQRLTALYEKMHNHFEKHSDEVSELVAGNPGATGANDVDVAAWTVVANALLNLDELLAKG